MERSASETMRNDRTRTTWSLSGSLLPLDEQQTAAKIENAMVGDQLAGADEQGLAIEQ